MKLRHFLAAMLLPPLLIAPATAQVSVSIGQPGFYGHIDIGGYPAPALIYPEPMIIRPAPVAAPPLYLRVPPGHAKNWRRYCDRYSACGRPVYFVQDDWYRHEYAPRYQERHGPRGPGPDYRNGYRDGYRDGDRFDDRGGRGGRDDRGPGHGHGHGRGRD